MRKREGRGAATTGGASAAGTASATVTGFDGAASTVSTGLGASTGAASGGPTGGRGGFRAGLRFFTQPAEQVFFLGGLIGRGRRSGLLVVVGTKHGGRLSQRCDTPAIRGPKHSQRRRIKLKRGAVIVGYLSRRGRQ